MSLELYIMVILIVLWVYLFHSMLCDEEKMEKQRKRCSRCPFECDKYGEEDE